MIQVLIVDDEVLCAEGVKCSLEWEVFGISRVFTAYSMKQAQQVLEREKIHIILCDVEMPKGSGLDLLTWAKEQGMHMITILLTSHATFQYAKQAIELGVMDYLLKPARKEALAEVFARAVKKVQESQMGLEKRELEEFYKEILKWGIDSKGAILTEQIWKKKMEFNGDDRYRAMLFHVYSAESKKKELVGGLAEDIRKMVNEQWEQAAVIWFDEYIIAIEGSSSQLLPAARAERIGHLILNEFFRKSGVKAACYLGEGTEADQLVISYSEMKKMDADNVACYSNVFYPGKEEHVEYQRPDIEEWLAPFSQGCWKESFLAFESWLDGIVREKRVSREVLRKLFGDFMQAFYIEVGKKGVQAHLLFQNEEMSELYRNAALSVEQMKKCVKCMIEKAASYIETAEKTDSVVVKVEKYICSHLGEELSRARLAEYVYLSQDYLTKVFRNEKGISLSEYIIQERMNQARILLKETDLTVGDIAWQVGYNNLAYFTKVFRERSKMTPVQYRISSRNSQNTQ